MSRQESDAEIAAFIRAHGVTRCPTACVARTHGSGNSADRAALRERADRLEALRVEKMKAWQRSVVAA